LNDRQRELLAFTRKCMNLRHTHGVLRRRHFFRGEPTYKGGPKDLSWIRSDGREMTDADWHNGDNHALGMLIYGEGTDETDDRGRPIKGDTLLLVLNASEDHVTFHMPAMNGNDSWAELTDSGSRELGVIGTGSVHVAPFSLVLLRYGGNRRVSNEEFTI
jgi:isoamylase